MRSNKIDINNSLSPLQADCVHGSLNQIKAMLENEILAQNTTIRFQQEELTRLRTELAAKDQVTNNLLQQMSDVQKKAEGNRQLVNKLLNDMERMQQDLGWYKRTYESRSLLGTIREKLFK